MDTKQTLIPIYYNYRKLGYQKLNCPSMLTIKEIEAQIDLDNKALYEYSESDLIKEENEEAQVKTPSQVYKNQIY